MRHDLGHAAKVGAVAALRTSGFAFLAIAAFHGALLAGVAELAVMFVLPAVLTLAGVTWFDEARRPREPALDPGETLNMAGPVWAEHPEADGAGPARRFT
jgi:hypothetical protein